MIPDIPTINISSMMVMELIGKLKTAPTHAQRIFFLFITLCITPMLLAPITIKVVRLVRKGFHPNKNEMPRVNSIKGYTKAYPGMYFAGRSYVL